MTFKHHLLKQAKLHHSCCPLGQYWWFNFNLKGYAMLIKTILVFSWIVILQFVMFILLAVANAYVDPVALMVLVPVTLLGICSIWFNDGEY
jgi:hypothetical protein